MQHEAGWFGPDFFLQLSAALVLLSQALGVQSTNNSGAQPNHKGAGAVHKLRTYMSSAATFFPHARIRSLRREKRLSENGRRDGLKCRVDNFALVLGRGEHELFTAITSHWSKTNCSSLNDDLLHSSPPDADCIAPASLIGNSVVMMHLLLDPWWLESEEREGARDALEAANLERRKGSLHYHWTWAVGDSSCLSTCIQDS